MSDAGGNKAELRTRFLARRRALSAEEVEKRSQAIADRFFTLPILTFSSVGYLHVFLPIEEKNEVDTWFIVRRIWRDYSGISLAVSVTDVTTNRLSHYRFTPDTALSNNRWGIPEPTICINELPPVVFTIVLVPLLAFDRQGHRVGYGRGYYDRFLAECRPDCQKIGLSLFEPVGEIENVERTDVRLNACVTTEQTYLF